jgi:hypothetical protein
MIAAAEAELGEAVLGGATTRSPLAVLEVGLDEEGTGFAAKLGGDGSLLNQAMWFDQPVPDIPGAGPTLPMVIVFSRSVGVLRHCIEVGFDAAIVDSSGRSVAHFAARGSMDMVGHWSRLSRISRSTFSRGLVRRSRAQPVGPMDRDDLPEVLLPEVRL